LSQSKYADNIYSFYSKSVEKKLIMHTFYDETGMHEMQHWLKMPKTALVRLNRLRTGVRRFRSCLH